VVDLAFGGHDEAMIFIVVRFTAKPEYRDSFLDEVAEFTQATRSEAGVLWFDWSRSVEDSSRYVLVEAFRDQAAGAEHVTSDHFKQGIATLQRLVAKTPDIINVEVPGDSWSKMGEIAVD